MLDLKVELEISLEEVIYLRKTSKMQDNKIERLNKKLKEREVISQGKDNPSNDLARKSNNLQEALAELRE